MGTSSGREREELLGWLASTRRHVLRAVDGLDDERLRRPVLPSGWTCLGLLRHLTLSDERYWFGVVVAGGSLDYWPEGDGADWRVGPDEDAAEVVGDYRRAIAASDAVLDGFDPDDPPLRPEDSWAEVGLAFPDVRSVVMHVVVETATHAGHLDAVRELLDGHQHLVL